MVTTGEMYISDTDGSGIRKLDPFVVTREGIDGWVAMSIVADGWVAMSIVADGWVAMSIVADCSTNRNVNSEA